MRKMTLAVGLACSLSAWADNCMVVELKDGSKNVFVLAEQPQVTFVGLEMNVKSAEVQTKYTLAEVENFHFEDVDVSGIADIMGHDTRFSYQNGILTVEGAEGQVRLVDTTGKVVESKTGNRVEFDMNGKKNGTYVVNMKGRSVKIIR